MTPGFKPFTVKWSTLGVTNKEQYCFLKEIFVLWLAQDARELHNCVLHYASFMINNFYVSRIAVIWSVHQLHKSSCLFYRLFMISEVNFEIRVTPTYWRSGGCIRMIAGKPLSEDILSLPVWAGENIILGLTRKLQKEITSGEMR